MLDLIPPTEQVSEQRRYPYQELASNKFTQSIFVLTQRLPHMLTSLTCVLGYLAAIPEGGGVLGKKAMATLTHMSTGGLLYVNSVFTIHVGGTRCVTSNADEIDLIDLIPPLIALIDLIDLTPPLDRI